MNQRIFVLAIFLLCSVFARIGYADDYQLKPRLIAQNTYVVEGAVEDFSFQNGGNILNTGFIVTSEGVLVIDTGPSRLYGEQLRKVIGDITRKSILRVYNTHLHPDHFLGNQAFEDIPIVALAGTIEGMRSQADMFTDNMYRLVDHWMAGTDALLPNEEITPGSQEIGGHRLSFIKLQGHTAADLVIFDHTTGVLFAGDLVFHNRAPTTPHANLTQWMKSLKQLETLEFKVIVPGHGAVADSTAPIIQTGNYLRWLDKTLKQQADAGMDMVEVLYLEIPSEFLTLAVMPSEYQRSVSHLYADLERQVLRPATQNNR